MRKRKPLIIDTLAPSLEEQARAWLALHPTSPVDAFERVCWQALTDFVSIADRLAARSRRRQQPPP
jgi:hypothetical protein